MSTMNRVHELLLTILVLVLAALWLGPVFLGVLDLCAWFVTDHTATWITWSAWKAVFAILWLPFFSILSKPIFADTGALMRYSTWIKAEKDKAKVRRAIKAFIAHSEREAKPDWFRAKTEHQGSFLDIFRRID